MKIRTITIVSGWVLSAVASTSAFAASEGLSSDGLYSHESSRRAIGTTAELMQQVAHAKARKSGQYQFETVVGATIDVAADSFYLEDGQLSMSGKAQAEENSAFILRGDTNSIYGWVVLKDSDLAYEYVTDSAGIVSVQRVPVTKIFPVCDLDHIGHEGPRGEEYANGWISGPEPHIGEYADQDLMKLESLPGATKVFYLDITRIMNGDTPMHFSKAEMWKTWQSVASSFSMYELNVTTDASVYAAAGVPNSGVARFLNQDGRSNAPLNSFGTTQFSSNYKNAEEGYGLGRTAAHEIGHQMGLLHDGGAGDGEYFKGIPAYKWTPMMGNYWPGSGWGADALYQWSYGEYTGASNSSQDDLKLIARYVDFREDDIPDSVELVVDNGTISPEDNRGFIGTTGDEDEFSFTIGGSGGHISVKIDRTEYIGGAMLDVHAEIRDASGGTVAESNPQAKRSAELDVDLDAGEYTIYITGGAEGTPQDGFSNYGSLGFYAIEGTIEGGEGSEDTEAPTVEIDAPGDGDEFEVGETVTIEATASDNEGVTSVEFFVDGKSIGTDDESPYEMDYDSADADAGDVEIEVIATDEAGNEGSASISITLTESSEDDDKDDEDKDDDTDDEDKDDDTDDEDEDSTSEDDSDDDEGTGSEDDEDSSSGDDDSDGDDDEDEDDDKDDKDDDDKSKDPGSGNDKSGGCSTAALGSDSLPWLGLGMFGLLGFRRRLR